MRKSAEVIIIVFLISYCGALFADEGMWEPSQLPNISEDIKASGFKKLIKE